MLSIRFTAMSPPFSFATHPAASQGSAARDAPRDVAPRWPAHIMFFYSDTDPAIWGANLPGSPVIAVTDPSTHLTQFVVTAQKWADGTDATAPPTHAHDHRR
jgi:hypothetical protein